MFCEIFDKIAKLMLFSNFLMKFFEHFRKFSGPWWVGPLNPWTAPHPRGRRQSCFDATYQNLCYSYHCTHILPQNPRKAFAAYRTVYIVGLSRNRWTHQLNDFSEYFSDFLLNNAKNREHISYFPLKNLLSLISI